MNLNYLKAMVMKDEIKMLIEFMQCLKAGGYHICRFDYDNKMPQYEKLEPLAFEFFDVNYYSLELSERDEVMKPPKENKV